MASDKGFPSKDRETSRDIPQDHITAGPVREKQWAKDTVAHSHVYEVGTDAVEASSTLSSINATAHVAKVGDIIRFTSGNLSSQEVSVLSTTTDAIELSELLSEAPATSDAFQILRFKYPVVNADGTLAVAAAAGGATEAKQDAGIVILTSLDGKDYATQTTLASLLAELQGKADLAETQPVSAASLPLPAGASTSANQTSSNTKLDSLLTELQLKADLTETQPVSASALPLPTGASTEATLASLLTELQGKADLAETQPVSAASLPLPTGASTETTLAAQSAKLPASLGQKTKAASLAVTLASDEDPLSVSLTGSAVDVVEFVRNDYTGTSVTTGAYVQLIASTSADVTKLQIFDSSGQTLVLALGAASSEVDKCYVFPGGNGDIDVSIPSGSRLSIKAVSATADAGEISINLIG